MNFQVCKKNKFCCEAKSIKRHTINPMGDSVCGYWCKFLPCDRFVSTGEPAAVIVFPLKIKVDEEIRPGVAAAGAPGGFLLGER